MPAIVGCQGMRHALQAAGPGIRGLQGCGFVGVTKTAGNGIHRAVIAIVVDQYIGGVEGWVAGAIIILQAQHRVQVAIVGRSRDTANREVSVIRSSTQRIRLGIKVTRV
nr:hypothetical protein pPsy0462a_00062 [Pseudomonas syringae]